MTASLPQLLTDTDLPDAELQAAALDGDVFRVDRAFCSVAEFDIPWRRAAALTISDSLVVATRSAAWVWGVVSEAPLRHEAFRPGPGGHSDDPPGLRVRQVAVDPADIVDFGAVRVTTPARTVVDLCRVTEFDEGVAAVVRRLVAEHRVDRAACDEVLERGRSLPHRRRARARLDALGLVSATGVTPPSGSPDGVSEGPSGHP